MTRFETLRPLGTGAFGQVSLVRERTTGQRLAMKVAHPYAQGQITARMRREYRALSKVQHQNVVQVYEYGNTEDGRAFITLEYVEGSTLELWLHHKPSHSQIMQVFLALADALGAVHQAGLLHRDLKPDNVMVTHDGVVKLMDFGLSKLSDASVQLTKAGTMLGTVLYMSPEQCRGEMLDVRSDWYAFGVLLYRALCGQVPFRGQNLIEVVMAHLQQPPTPPRDHNPELGTALNEFVLSLLAKNPSQRPANADVVRRGLLEALEQPTTTHVVTTPRANFLLKVPLLGRDSELAKLQHALESGEQIWLSGTAGIGKSELLVGLRQHSLRTWIQCAAIADETTPFGVVSRFIEALERQGLLTCAPTEHRAIWQELAPWVNLDAPTPVRSTDPALGKLQLLEGFAALLDYTTDCVLVFEDLHWADAASLELLRYGFIQHPKTCLVVSYRSDEFAARKHLPNPTLHIELTGLQETTMLQLVQGWLGAPLEAALSQELLRGTGGNPWFLRERLCSMIEDGNIVQRLGVFEWTRSVVYLPESVAELLHKRVQNLSKPALEFAQAGSIFGQQFEFTDVQQLLGWSEDACFDALEDLLRLQLVTEHHADVFVFAHPSFAEALYQNILSLKQRLWHTRAAQLLETRADNATLARHFLRGGEPNQAVPLALTAGLDYLARFAYPQAESAFRLALSAASDPKHIAQTQQGLGKALYALGHVPEALSLWQTALENTSLEPQATHQIRLALATARSTQGEHNAAIVVLAALDDPDAMLVRADCLQRAGQNQASIVCCLAVLPSLRRAKDTAGQSRALTTLAWAMHSQGRYRRGLALAQLAIRKAADNPHLRLLAHRALYANQYDLEDFSGAEQTLSAALAMPITGSQLQHQLWFEMALANVLVLKNQLPKAAQHYAQVLNNAKRAEVQSVVEKSAFSLVLAFQMQNQLPEAQSALEHLENPSIKRLWQCRLALATGNTTHPPPNLQDLPNWTHGLQGICHLEWLLEQHQDQTILGCQPDGQYQWFWAVARLIALWRSGLSWTLALQASQQPMPDAGLAQALLVSWNRALEDALLYKNTQALHSLRRSAMGVYARAILGF
jgi:tetratricopeptide (TPR) repeat protein